MLDGDDLDVYIVVLSFGWGGSGFSRVFCLGCGWLMGWRQWDFGGTQTVAGLIEMALCSGDRVRHVVGDHFSCEARIVGEPVITDGGQECRYCWVSEACVRELYVFGVEFVANGQINRWCWVHGEGKVP